MTKDRLLEMLQLGPGLETEIIDECSPRVCVHAECLRLPARAVQGEHQLRPQALPERMALDQCVELGDEAMVVAKRELCVEPFLERR